MIAAVYAVFSMTNFASSENATAGTLMGENVHLTRIVHADVILVVKYVIQENAIAAVPSAQASA